MILHRKNKPKARGHMSGKLVRNKRISITLTDKCFDLLSKQAELTSLSMAQVIRQFLPGGTE